MNYLDFANYQDLPVAHRNRMSTLLESLFVETDAQLGAARPTMQSKEVLIQHWRRGARARVAIDNNVVAGFVLYYPSSDSFFVDWLVVDKDSRRQGIGSELITTIRDRASRRNALSVLLDVPPKNKGARQFYKKLGFCYDGPGSMVLPIY